MSLPSVRQSTDLSSPAARALTRSAGRALVHRQNAEVARGLVAATRIEAAALSASVGIQCAGMLGREAQFQSDGDPVIANRLNHIIDQFACFVGAEVARFGH